MILHLVAAFISLTLFLAAFVLGIFLILKERAIKSKEVFSFLMRFPSIERLQQWLGIQVTLGFLFLTLTMVSGVILIFSVEDVSFNSNWHFIVAIIAWLIYGVVIRFRIRRNWETRNGIILSLIGFLALLSLFLGSRSL